MTQLERIGEYTLLVAKVSFFLRGTLTVRLDAPFTLVTSQPSLLFFFFFVCVYFR